MFEYFPIDRKNSWLTVTLCEKGEGVVLSFVTSYFKYSYMYLIDRIETLCCATIVNNRKHLQINVWKRSLLPIRPPVVALEALLSFCFWTINRYIRFGIELKTPFSHTCERFWHPFFYLPTVGYPRGLYSYICIDISIYLSI